MQQEIGDQEGQSFSHLLERPISPSQRGHAEGEQAIMAGAGGIVLDTITVAAAAAAAAAFAPGFHADGQDQQPMAGSSDTALSGALDLLASISDER